jgi:DNA-binding LacI/PurR family transcriptional regulator
LAVVLCVPHREFIRYPYYSEIIAGLQEAMGQAGRTLAVFAATPDSVGHLPQQIDASLFSGVVALGPEPCPELATLAARVPLLQLNYQEKDPARSFLLRDEEQSAHLVFNHLVAFGVKRVKVVTLFRHPSQEARRGVMDRVARSYPDLSFDMEALAETREALYRRDMLETLFKDLSEARLKNLVARTEAVVCLSTYGEILYRRLLSAGISIPGKLGFMTDGMMMVERTYFPEVTRFGVPADDIAAHILDFFENPKPGQTILMKSVLWQGESLSQTTPVNLSKVP